MNVLKDLECNECGNEFEGLVDNAAKDGICPKCASTARVVFRSLKFQLDGKDPGFPGAYDKWARHHEKAAKS